MTMPLLGALTSLDTRIGWYAYAPLSGQAFQPQGAGGPAWLRLIIWLAAFGFSSDDDEERTWMHVIGTGDSSDPVLTRQVLNTALAGLNRPTLDR